MTQNILVPDALRKSVEKATDGKCTVLYTSQGLPTYMTIIPAFKCEDIAGDLGTGLHPAFIVGGKEVSEIMVGTYLSIVHDGQAISLPYQNPRASISHDDAIDDELGIGGDRPVVHEEWPSEGEHELRQVPFAPRRKRDDLPTRENHDRIRTHFLET